jgi:hypothetical protein
MIVTHFPTQYTVYKGTRLTLSEYSDIDRAKRWIKSLTRGKRKQAIEIICSKEYVVAFPEFDIDIESDDTVQLKQYF